MPKASITALPQPGDFVRFAPGFGRRFIVTVDTEEEFDWGAPFARAQHSLDSVPRLAKFQQFCEGFGRKKFFRDQPLFLNEPDEHEPR